jgi:phage minor structural protein
MEVGLMFPILYPPGERAFTTGGLATLTDCTKCTVTEERNGAFELVLQYPANGKYFSLLQEDCVVLAKPNLDDDPQPFRLYKSERKMSGLTTWHGEHFVYFANDVPVEIIPSTSTNPAGAFAKLSAACAIPCPFTFSTDITTVAAFGLATPSPLKKVLGGMEGSIIDAFGGEYHYNGLAVQLCKARGANKGFRVEYGRNLTDINQEKALSKVTTAIYPYWQGQNDAGSDTTVTLPEKIVELEGAPEYGHPHCKTIDFSQDLGSAVPTVEALRAAATAYLTTSGIAEPAVSITLKYAQLSSLGQNRILEQIGAAALCDTVTVYFDRLGIEAEAKIIKTVFDALKERFDEVEVGEAKSTLSATINNNRVEPEKIIKTATTSAKLTAADLVQAAADRITAGMSGASGGYVVQRPALNPSETLYMDAPTIAEAKNIMRLNSAGISFSTNGIDGPFSGALAINGEWFAQFIATWNLTANIIKAGILQDATGKNSINLDTGEVNLDCASLKVQGKTAEAIAAEQAQEAAAAAEQAAIAQLDAYKTTVTGDLADLQGQIDGQITTWFYDYAPATNLAPSASWTTDEEKENHAGDLFYNNLTGYAYRWALVADVWQWLRITDTDVTTALANAEKAQDTADGKRRTFITQPAPPYDVGDLWAKGAAGELMVCATARASGSYAAADWVPAADYVNSTGAAIAGRNLVNNSGLLGVASADIMTVADGVATFSSADATKYRSLTLPLTDTALANIAGKKLTVSCDVMVATAVQVASTDAAFVAVRLWVEYNDDTVTTALAFYGAKGTTVAATSGYTRFSATATVKNKTIKNASVSLIFQYAAGSIKYRRPQVELGSAATPWAPAPEDSTVAAAAPALTQQEVFNRLTNNGQLQGLYMKDGKLYINAQYIAAGRIASADGVSYFDLVQGVANLKGVFSTEPFTNSTGTYRVTFDSNKIACQKKNAAGQWDDAGFIQWNYGVNPPEPWIKGARFDATQSVTTPEVWCGKFVPTAGANWEFVWDGAISRWVLAQK